MKKNKRNTKKTYEQHLKRKPRKVFLNQQEIDVITESMKELGFESFSDYIRNISLEKGNTILLAKPSEILKAISDVSKELVSLQKLIVKDQKFTPIEASLNELRDLLKVELNKLYLTV